MKTQITDMQGDISVSFDFIPVLAHEVRNPLTNINLSVEILDSFLHDSEMKVYTEVIRRNVGRINQLILDLLNRQKFADMMPVQLSVHDLLNEVVAITHDRCSLKHIEIVKSFEEDRLVVWNRSNMIIALTNIVINAVDAMSSTTGVLQLTAKCDDGKYVLRIKDNGCGISKQNLKNIFKAYYTSKEGGLGLGLSITLAILKQNGIDVVVESSAGYGTCFILSF
ncbi:MAG: HAMP domain-containing histidine kinase [Sphingobacteriales bacterium]|nr:MAG: HAMP domain-containing histidine kinase [Sphingobacteriales bacterium]